MPYDRPPNPLDAVSNALRRGGIPFTTGVLISVIVTTIGLVFFSRHLLLPYQHLWFYAPSAASQPWSIVTYPFVESPPDSFNFLVWIINLVFFWFTAGSLERSWGTARFAQVFLALAAIGAGAMLLCQLVVHASGLLHGLELPMAAVAVAFCCLEPNRPMAFWFVPMKAKYLSILMVVYTFIAFGPIVGAFANLTLLAAYLYVTYGRSWADTGYTRRSDNVIDLRTFQRRQPVKYLDGSIQRSQFDLVGRWRDRQERRRLERLLRNSGLIDPDDRRDERLR